MGSAKCLHLLDVDALNLLYVHWPVSNYNPDEKLPTLNGVVDDGLASHVGVSNFSVEMVDTVLETLETPLFAHQVDRHPRFHGLNWWHTHRSTATRSSRTHRSAVGTHSRCHR